MYRVGAMCVAFVEIAGREVVYVARVILKTTVKPAKMTARELVGNV